MSTLKVTIRKNEKRSDGTWNVLIRVTHNRRSAYIRTSMFVEKKDLTASFKIKNASILDKCRELENEYRKRLAKLNLELCDLELEQIMNYLENTTASSSIDFVEFCNNWIEKHKSLKGVKNYKSALNSFITFCGRKRIFCDEITSKVLKQFEDSLSLKKRASSMYPQSILKLFNEARAFYNDEEIGIFKIRHSINYKPKKQNVAEKRSLTEDIIRAIHELPYDAKESSRRNLAKDCFMLSFCLMGINSVDLFNAKEYDGEYLIYNRTKTKDRRPNDGAKMVVKVHPFIKPVFDKYYSGDKHVFNFSKRFSSYGDLNRSINIGLKQIKKELGIEKLQFYAENFVFDLD